MAVRKSILAGSWYPATASECEREINAFVKEFEGIKEKPENTFCGGIVPHAGWYFSGSIACNVIKRLSLPPQPDVLVIFGMHLHTNSSNYIMTQGAWETPFGDIEIEPAVAEKLADQFPFLIETPERFVQDNTIEVQLPFVKYFFKSTPIVPIGVPPTMASLDIGKAVAEISKHSGLTMKVIGSTDLTHYGANYGYSPKGLGPKAREWVEQENDANMVDTILAMDAHGILKQAREHQNACCSGAVATAVTAAKAMGAQKAHELAYATSYNKSPGDSFVGYVGVLFE
jgi:hypothetical protein